MRKRLNPRDTCLTSAGSIHLREDREGKGLDTQVFLSKGEEGITGNRGEFILEGTTGKLGRTGGRKKTRRRKASIQSESRPDGNDEEKRSVKTAKGKSLLLDRDQR